MPTMSARLEDWLKDSIESFWRDHGEGPSGGLRRVAQEWWAMQQFPDIAFEDGMSGRRARLRRGPDVWEVVDVWRSYNPDRSAFYEHFAAQITQSELDQALAYAARFPEEIEREIEENNRVERLLNRTNR